MNGSRRVLIIESDSRTVDQMRRVLAAMELEAVAVAGEDEFQCALGSLDGAALIVARVALPTGSGIKLLEQAQARFPDAGQLLISHHPRTLLSSMPGFLDHSLYFLKAEFTDAQFRGAVERALARRAAPSI